VVVNVQLDQPGVPGVAGKLVFVDNVVDSASGTIRLKAAFPNAGSRLWPGMFVAVSIAPRLLTGALTLPVQAVQTGPERKFVYLIGDEGKVSVVPVKVSLIQDGIAVIEGIAAGSRVVLEGAQNLRPGSVVSEAKAAAIADKSGKP
jgi:RND family efflux transporter MFP subunit